MTNEKFENHEDTEPTQKVKIVAELPGDKEMQDKLQDMKENDGYPGSCGI